MSIDSRGIMWCFGKAYRGDGWFNYQAFVEAMCSMHVADLSSIEVPSTILQTWTALCKLALWSNGDLLGARLLLCDDDDKLRTHNCESCTAHKALADACAGGNSYCATLQHHVSLHLGLPFTLTSLKQLLDSQTVVSALQERSESDMLREAIERSVSSALTPMIGKQITSFSHVDAVVRQGLAAAKVQVVLPANVETISFTCTINPEVKL